VGSYESPMPNLRKPSPLVGNLDYIFHTYFARTSKELLTNVIVADGMLRKGPLHLRSDHLSSVSQACVREWGLLLFLSFLTQDEISVVGTELQSLRFPNIDRYVILLRLAGSAAAVGHVPLQ